ncbi:MAG: histidine kinase [Mycobacteriales bacterium]|nr:histidine kinase [Mycobacteriales bacterium]
MGLPRRRALALLLLHTVLLCVALLVLALGGHNRTGGSDSWWLLAGAVPASLVAALLADRRPGTTVGRCLAVLASAQLLSVTARVLSQDWQRSSWVSDRLGDVLFVGTLPVLALLVVAFPDRARGRWRAVQRGQVALLSAAALLVVVAGRDGVASAAARGAVVVVVLAGVVRIGELVRTWRRASGEERTPYTWFVVGAASLLPLYATGAVLSALDITALDGPATAYVLGVLPASLGLAIVRGRLYELDIVVNRALVLSTTSVVLLLAYVTLAAAAGATGASPGRPAVSAVLAVATALAFGTVRQAAQRLVDRALYGDRDEPGRALQRLGQQLAGAVAPEEVADRVVDAVRAAIRSPSVELLTDDLGRPGDFVLEHAGHRLGVLRVAPRVGEQALSAHDTALLHDLARQAAVALYAGRLADDLAASRERLVASREEERARLRRDLHDELSPSLAGIALSVGAARARVHDDPDGAEQLLARVADESRATTGVVRRVLAGLAPPGLAELGLVAALERRVDELSHAGQCRVTLVVEGVPAVPPDVEVVAYRVAVEGVANALRHSGAGAVQVRVRQDETRLSVEVADDGCGPPAPDQEGNGIRGCRSRVRELGGHLALTPLEDGGGTRLEAVLPVSGGADR